MFFDTLGVKYEYEPEGFHLPSGKCYLPDFKVKCYGDRGSCLGENEISICESCVHRNGSYISMADWLSNPFCEYFSEKDFENPPTFMTFSEKWGNITECRRYKMREPYDLYIEVKGIMTAEDADKISEFAKYYPILVVSQIPNLGCSHDSFELGAYKGMNGFCISPFNYETIDGDNFGAYPAACNGKFFLWGDDDNYIWNRTEVEDAYTKARQARFEHGESR